jgi:formate hydrogenlyase subunit 6/NADH:ubiquinone oxidoreductase subunit I
MLDIYTRLASYLDTLPAGYPPTKDGVELQILQKLFTEEEAELALHLMILDEPVSVIAHKAGLEQDYASKLLEGMVQKGLISGSYPVGKPPVYSISQFVVGFYEDQVNRLDAELVDLFEAYAPIYFDKGPWKKQPQIRTIPVMEAIPVTPEVLPYMQVEAILQSKTDFAVRNCVCRQEKEILDKGCGKPMETCMMFDSAARNTVKTGKGRMISLEEAQGILKKARKAGLVIQPSNSQDPIFLCACCSCCCGVLSNIKNHPNPGALVANPYFAQYDPAYCIACGACAEICPMAALSTDENWEVNFDQTRCIGCGLCITVCPSESLKLGGKPDLDQPKIPKNITQTYLSISKARGLGNLVSIVWILIKNYIITIKVKR